PQLDQILQLQANLLNAQAKVYLKKENFAKAAKLFKDSLDTCDALPKKAIKLSLVAIALSDLADCLEKEAKYLGTDKRLDERKAKLEGALFYQQQAIDFQEAYIKHEPADFTRRGTAGVIWYNKGYYLSLDNKYEPALEAYLKAKAYQIEA